MQNAIAQFSEVPYYRQLLPIFNLFKAKNMNIGDGIESTPRASGNDASLRANLARVKGLSVELR